MKPAFALSLAAVLSALALPACGGGATSTSKAATSSSTGKSSTAPATTSGKAAESLTAKSATAPAMEDDDGQTEKMSEAIKVLDDMPSQDELDAAAAARITEASADAEYQQLKAEIEADIAKSAEDG